MTVPVRSRSEATEGSEGENGLAVGHPVEAPRVLEHNRSRKGQSVGTAPVKKRERRRDRNPLPLRRGKGKGAAPRESTRTTLGRKR